MTRVKRMETEGWIVTRLVCTPSSLLVEMAKGVNRQLIQIEVGYGNSTSRIGEPEKSHFIR
jgi:hypothetical protein